jgi:hypothetical protein
MPRFFFDIHDGKDFTPDRQGLDLDDLEAAKDEAKKALPDIVRDEMPDGDRRDFTVDVRTWPDGSSGGSRCRWLWKAHPKAQQQTPDREHELRVSAFMELASSHFLEGGTISFG